MTSSITISGLTKLYNGKRALDAIDLEIAGGELIALLGSSGCGKTTLLRCIAGLTEPEEGRIFFGPDDLTRVPTQSRPIGMVFQSTRCFPT